MFTSNIARLSFLEKMNLLIAQLKPFARSVLQPFRGVITWACQQGMLPLGVRNILPHRWAHKPFTIYGEGWKCNWMPTEFDGIGHTIFWSGLRVWERETVPVILSELRQSHCFLDIGANCGIYSVMGCTINPNLRVVAIEPVPKTFAALSGNIQANHFEPRIHAVNTALGESNGIVSFHEAADATMSSLATEGYLGQSGNVIQVSCRTLDSLVEELHIEPDFMKIDVEGFEHVVLAGATQVLTKYRPRMVLEANPQDPCHLVSDILAEHGYQFQLLTENGPQTKPAIVADQQFRNWLCTPKK